MPTKSKSAPTDIIAALKASARREPVASTGAFARALTAGDVRRIMEACRIEGKSPGDADGYDDLRMQRMMIAAAIVDGAGEPIFAGREDEIDDLPNETVMAMQTAALRVNGMGGGDA